uniref:DUF4220 domain-containing protein n=1 Tax=Oryza nivara TaxID=4536 RepID=A0A0E0H065_ORYNI
MRMPSLLINWFLCGHHSSSYSLDTIIGFSLEDNNLWLRHLLNLVVQVVLTLYIFWKSAIGPNMNKVELVMSILLFVTGTIKYGERTWALQYGVLRTLAASLPRYALQLRNSFQKSLPICPGCDRDKYIGQLLDNADSGTNDDDDPFPEPLVLSIALCSMPSALRLFWDNDTICIVMNEWVLVRAYQLPKALEILEIELGLVYDYIYTKAVVFQARRGIALRCISQASFLAVFLLFLVSNIQRHNSINTVITYALFLASIVMRLQRRRVWWSNSMGQYKQRNHLAKYDEEEKRSRSWSWKRGVVGGKIRKVVDAVCGEKVKFWISKQLDINFAKVDKEIIRCIFNKVVECAAEAHQSQNSLPAQEWSNLSVLLKNLLETPDGTLSWETIVVLHVYTKVQLKLFSHASPSESTSAALVELVHKLSNYMLYLLATQHEMLPVSKSTGESNRGVGSHFAKIDIEAAETEMLTNTGVQLLGSCTKEQLLETKQAWLRLLIFFAGKSRPEMHTAQLAAGGELLTFVWLFMAFKDIGASVISRIEISDL